MAKYIDLLRAHQNEQSKPPAAAEKEFEQQYDQLENMLADEEKLFSRAAPSDEDLLPDELPSETTEEYRSEISESSGTAPEISDWLTHLITLLLQLFGEARDNRKTSIQPLSTQILELLERLDGNDTLLNDLELDIAKRITHIREQDSDLGNLVQKSIIMMLYAIKMGMRLHLQRADILSHTLAAMLHHIGMAQVAADIRNKKGRLTKKEIEEIRQAPSRAQTYLTECGITDSVILLAASQSNERFDGSGPQGLSNTDISYSARMVGLLSMFEALIHFRPYRHRLLPRDAIRELVNHHKKAFDPVMLKALIESISLYPVGTYIQLNTGEVGLVTQVNDRLPLRPKVLLNMDSRGGAIPPRTVNLKEQPNLMIQHCMYEEGLAELKNTSEKQRRR